LSTGTDDTLATLITNVLGILLVGTLPDLNFAATANHTHTHGREQVVSGVGVVVDTTVEHGGGILANTGVDHGLTAGVVLDEISHIVDNTSDSNQTAAVLGLLDIVVPLHDGELLQGGTPVQLGALLVNLLLQLLDAALLDFVGTELLQVIGETQLLPGPDGPLGRVILVPLDGIAVVGGELVVEVVVSLTESDKGSDNVVTGRVAVVEGLVTEPVSQRVDAESGLLDEEDTEDTGVDESTEPVTPAKTSNEHGDDQTHTEDNLEVVAVLPDDDWVLVQIRDVGSANSLGVLLHDHPAEVRVPETLANGVRVLFGIGVTVVSTVATSPPADRTLNGTAANQGEPDAERQGSRVGAVSPETVITCQM